MKKCPKCGTEYFDNRLDFCLEDGEKLSGSISQDEELWTIPTIRKENKDFTETQVLEDSELERADRTLEKKKEFLNRPSSDTTKKINRLKQNLSVRGLKILENTALICALLHNFWFWLYFSRKPYNNFADYFISVEFIVWFLLLITGIMFGIISLKFNQNKIPAIIALVVLAVNFILSIIPK